MSADPSICKPNESANSNFDEKVLFEFISKGDNTIDYQLFRHPNIIIFVVYVEDIVKIFKYVGDKLYCKIIYLTKHPYFVHFSRAVSTTVLKNVLSQHSFSYYDTDSVIFKSQFCGIVNELPLMYDDISSAFLIFCINKEPNVIQQPVDHMDDMHLDDA